MKKQCALNLLIIALYLALITVFFVFFKFKRGEDCLQPECVTICFKVQNSTLFNETTNEYYVTHPVTNQTSVFKRFFEDIPCGNTEIVPHESWKFSFVSFSQEKTLTQPRNHAKLFLFTERSYFCNARRKLLVLNAQILYQRKCKQRDDAGFRHDRLFRKSQVF